MTNEEINNYLRLAIMEEVNKRMGKNFECIYDLCDYAKNLEKENKQLKAQIEKMKCCENCKGVCNSDDVAYFCKNNNYKLWEVEK